MKVKVKVKYSKNYFGIAVKVPNQGVFVKTDGKISHFWLADDAEIEFDTETDLTLRETCEKLLQQIKALPEPSLQERFDELERLIKERGGEE